MFECIVSVVIWSALMILAGLLIQWAIKEVFGKDIPPRIVQVATFLVMFIAIVGLISCMFGSGPLLPLPWRRM